MAQQGLNFFSHCADVRVRASVPCFEFLLRHEQSLPAEALLVAVHPSSAVHCLFRFGTEEGRYGRRRERTGGGWSPLHAIAFELHRRDVLEATSRHATVERFYLSQFLKLRGCWGRRTQMAVAFQDSLF